MCQFDLRWDVERARNVFGETPLRKKWEESRQRLGEPSNCDAGLTPYVGEREGRKVG